MYYTKFILLSFLYSYISVAQDYIYENFTVNEGLSSSEIYDITQDKNGFIWFATDRGLTRYNGYDFKKYTDKDGLTDIVVFNFYEQPDGKIWCSTFNKKLFYYDPDKDQFVAYQYNDCLTDIPVNITINNLHIDSDNAIFITFKGALGYLKVGANGDMQNQIRKIKKGVEYCYIKASINPDLISYNFNNKIEPSLNTSDYIITKIFRPGFEYYNTIYKGSRNHLVVISSLGISVVNTKDKSEKHIPSENRIIIAGEYDDDHFWIGIQHGGIKIYDYNGNLTGHFLTDKSVTKIFKDHEDGLWISTIDSGVFYVKHPKILTYRSHIGVKNNHAYRLTKNNENTLYVSYHDGRVYKRDNSIFQLIWESPNNYKSEVQYYKKDKRLIIRSAHNIWQEYSDLVRNVGQGGMLSDNSLYAPIIGKDFFQQLLPDTIIKITKRVSKRVHDTEYSNDGYYLATFSGLYKYKNDSIYDVKKENPLMSYRMDDIDRYKENYYIASMGAGLIVKNEDIIYSINQSNGLNSDLTTQVYIENEHEIYITSNNGLNRILFDKNHKSYTVSGISIEEGLPSNEVNDIEVINDTIWVATKDGLCSLPKSLLTKPIDLVYKNWLRIDSVKVNNKLIKDVTELKELRHYDNTVTFNFSAISFKNGANTMYRYRLLGIESEWNVTNNKEVRYPELEPGDYIFEIQTKGANKHWNTISEKMILIIEPPFWERWWFYILLILSMLLIIFSFFKFRILSYNRDIIRELLRFVLKKIRGDKQYITIKESGTEIKLNTTQINYIKASGNYLEIYTAKGMFLIRGKIGNFEKQLPDAIEYIRIHRSYLIRIDKVQQKNHKTLQINNEVIPVGKTYKQNLDKIMFE